jgi:sucrose-6F-phosphate phosphohydrolase
MLASDLDGTLIPRTDIPDYAEPLARFKEVFKTRSDCMLAYVTGRGLDLAREGIRQTGLPRPDVMVCDVGTSIYHFKSGEWQPDESYRQSMQQQLGAASMQETTALLREYEGITPQEPEQQAEFKNSFYMDLSRTDRSVVDAIQGRLKQQGFQISPIYSVDPLRQCGLLDLLPGGTGKDFSLFYLSRLFDLPQNQLLFSGDSGNDMRAFLSGFSAIAVGNTPDAVKEEARTRRQKGTRLYISNAPLINGVLEGMRHYGML